MNEYNTNIGSLMSVFKSANGDTKQIVADIKEKGIGLPTEQQLPAIISSQYNNIVELEDSVVKSIKLAKDAESSAKKASDFTVHWYGGRKEAIELLQDASEYSSKALISLAEAQKKSFEYQTKLTEITKFLFGLGVSSIAMNRCVVRELELKLKGASDEDISDLAKQELKNVILQLKAQEDMMQKQEFLTGKVKEQAGQLKEIDKQLDDIEEADEEQDEKIAENAANITRHSQALSAQQQKDEEHDKRIFENAEDIDELEKQDEEQDKLIAVGIAKDKEHDERISENAQDIDELERQDKEQDEKIEDIVKKIDEHSRLLDNHAKQDKELEKKIQDASQNTAVMFANIRENISENANIANKNISLLENNLGKRINDLKDDIQTSNENFELKLTNLSTEFKNEIAELKEELKTQDEEINSKIESLENRLNSLDIVVSKKVWKIAISVVAGVSLLLNILSVIGVL